MSREIVSFNGTAFDCGSIPSVTVRSRLNRLEIQVTVDDPKAYTRPWTATLNQFILADTDLLDYICNENEKDTQHFTGKQ